MARSNLPKVVQDQNRPTRDENSAPDLKWMQGLRSFAWVLNPVECGSVEERWGKSETFTTHKCLTLATQGPNCAENLRRKTDGRMLAPDTTSVIYLGPRKEIAMTAVKLKLVEEETKSPAVPATKARSTRTSKVASGSVPAPKSPAKKKAPAPKVQKRETYAADLMTATPIYCHMNDSLNEAARQMWENNVGAIAIVNDAKMPVAMLTDRDICVAAYTQGRPLYECGVASAMSKTLVSCATDTPLSEVRDLMAEEKVRRLPVVDKQGVLVGMLGFSDLMEEAHMDLPKDRKRGSTGPMLVQMVHAVLKDERS